jgi:RimJ/RimL family protein N-acetyltransferase
VTNAAIVETPRLRLRRPAWDDMDELTILAADVDVMRYIGNGQTQSRAEVEQWLAGELDGRRPEHLPGWLVIESKQNGALLGLAALKSLAEHHLKAAEVEPTDEVGYRLAKPYWGQGFATEATVALVKFDRQNRK